MKNQAIGIFDSGVGGLSLLEPLVNSFENEDFVYCGDSKRAPWGSKGKKELEDIVTEVIDYLNSQPVKCIIMGCNTSCALFYEKLKEKLDIPIIGLLEGLCLEALSATKNKSIGILATEQSINSQYFRKKLHSYNDSLQIHELASPKLVPIIEENTVDLKESIHIVENYLSTLLEKNIDTLIYGCTHYPFLDKVIKSIVPKSLKIINPATLVSSNLNQVLSEKKLFSPSKEKGTISIFYSGNKKGLSFFLNKIAIKNTEFKETNFKKET